MGRSSQMEAIITLLGPIRKPKSRTEVTATQMNKGHACPGGPTQTLGHSYPTGSGLSSSPLEQGHCPSRDYPTSLEMLEMPSPRVQASQVLLGPRGRLSGAGTLGVSTASEPFLPHTLHCNWLVIRSNPLYCPTPAPQTVRTGWTSSLLYSQGLPGRA